MSEPVIYDSPLYLIIVIHTLNQDETINYEIINGFETNDEKSFVLSRTYGQEKEPHFYKLSTKNFITVRKDKDFKTRVHGEGIEGSNEGGDIREKGYDIRDDYVVYSKDKLLYNTKENQCIFFYIYDNNNTKIETYFTKGSLFIFKNGIASTKSIRIYKENKTHEEDIKYIIEEYDLYKKDPENPENLTTTLPKNVTTTPPKNVTATLPKNVTATPPKNVTTTPKNLKYDFLKTTKSNINGIKQTNASILRDEANKNGTIKKKIVLGGAGSIEKIITDLNNKMKDVNILYLNSILPNVLFNLLFKEGFQNTNSLNVLKNTVKLLYVNICMPSEIDTVGFKLYNEFYNAINSFYLKKNTGKEEIYNTELKKEIDTFRRKNEYEKKMKIDIYIDLINEKNNIMNKIRNYEKISFSMHIFDFANFLKENRNNVKFSDIFTTIYNNSLIPRELSSFGYILEKMQGIKKEIEKNTKGIYTYLQIKNFDHTSQTNFNAPYNERFNIKLNIKNKKSMIMEYFNASFPFYDNGKLSIKPDTKGIKLKIEGEKQINEIDKIEYGSKFVFGKFNKIFEPDKSSKDIAVNGLTLIVEKMLEQKPVFLMGWGESGSGKTSSLIYYTKNDEPGILIYLCEILGIKGYTNIELECIELFESYEGSNQEEKSDSGEVSKSQFFNFNYNKENGFTIGKKYTYNQVHKHRSKPLDFTDPNLKLQNVMKYLIDDDRLVKATPNNPNSSRSHVLCFLTLSNADNSKKANIIVGDLAGVENTFNCNNSLEIRKFFDLKRNGTKDKFYKDEIMSFGEDKNIFDPIFGEESKIGSNMDSNTMDSNTMNSNTKTEYQNFMKKPLFDFSDIESLTKLGFDFESEYKVGYENYVNIILEKIDGKKKLNNKNLGSKIITEGDKILEKINNFKIDTTYDEKLADSLLNVYYGSTWKNKILSTKDYVGMPKEKSDKKKEEFIQEKRIEIFNILWKEENIRKVLNKIKENIIYIKFIKKACEHRKTEGTFINKSLLDLSQDLMNIVNLKNENNLYYIPNIVDKCFPSYCPTFNKCFNIEHQKNLSINSIITQTIAKKLGYENDDNGIKNFFNNLEVAIFGVFNWSRIANNPPPVPYVDINILSQMIFEKDQISFNMKNFKYEVSKKIEELTQSKVSSEALIILKDIQTIVEKRSSIDEQIAIEIRDKLTYIDKTNSLTGIGTIEFVDRISKLNSISNNCFGISEEDFTDIYPKKKFGK
jgi:hypothetical protein